MTCKSCRSTVPDRKQSLVESMLPIMKPEHNLREICKELSLLEDHLNHSSKRCPDCITKHFLKLEALAEEGLSLCNADDSIASTCETLAGLFRKLLMMVMREHRHREAASHCRTIRKKLMPMVFHVV